MASDSRIRNESCFVRFSIASLCAVLMVLYVLYERTKFIYVFPTPARNIQHRTYHQNQTSIDYIYHVLNRKDVYYIGDKIQVLIEAQDINGNLEQTGGAYFRAKLMSKDVKAASRSDGEIIDYGNGRYLAEFILRWPGRVRVAVILVDSSAAVRILKRMRKEFPNRGSYIAEYKNSSNQESTTCNVDHVAPKENECDFTDSETNIHWFCERPTNPNLRCEHWWRHVSNNTLLYEQQRNYIRAGEEKHFKRYKRYLTCKDCEINVQRNQTAELREGVDEQQRLPWQKDWTTLPKCLPGNISKTDNETSGYLYKGTWYSTRCRNRKFGAVGAAQCLANKTVLILADSTGLQLYTYLKDLLKLVDIPPIDCMIEARRDEINFATYFKFHGLPVRGDHGGPRSCFQHHIPYVLDHLTFTPDVFIFSIGAHYSIHTLKLLEERLLLIRAAVERLHKRSPKTLFIIKSVNTRDFKNLSHILTNNDWYLYTIDRLVRECFVGYSHVAFVDAWDMTVAQFCPDNVHPKPETLRNIVDMTLSYICPI